MSKIPSNYNNNMEDKSTELIGKIIHENKNYIENPSGNNPPSQQNINSQKNYYNKNGNNYEEDMNEEIPDENPIINKIENNPIPSQNINLSSKIISLGKKDELPNSKLNKNEEKTITGIYFKKGNNLAKGNINSKILKNIDNNDENEFQNNNQNQQNNNYIISDDSKNPISYIYGNYNKNQNNFNMNNNLNNNNDINKGSNIQNNSYIQNKMMNNNQLNNNNIITQNNYINNLNNGNNISNNNIGDNKNIDAPYQADNTKINKFNEFSIFNENNINDTIKSNDNKNIQNKQISEQVYSNQGGETNQQFVNNNQNNNKENPYSKINLSINLNNKMNDNGNIMNNQNSKINEQNKNNNFMNIENNNNPNDNIMNNNNDMNNQNNPNNNFMNNQNNNTMKHHNSNNIEKNQIDSNNNLMNIQNNPNFNIMNNQNNNNLMNNQNQNNFMNNQNNFMNAQNQNNIMNIQNIQNQNNFMNNQNNFMNNQNNFMDKQNNQNIQNQNNFMNNQNNQNQNNFMNNQNNNNIGPKEPPKYSFSRYKKASRVGLLNLGDTSYLNAVLQFLGSIRNFASYFLNPKNIQIINNDIKEKPFSFVIYRLFLHLYPFPESDKINNYKPETLLDFLGKINSVYRSRKRRNPNDLINFILNRLNKELIIKMKAANQILYPKNISDKTHVINIGCNNFQKYNNSIISNNLNWFEIKEIKCTICGNNMYYFQSYNTFELDILLTYKYSQSKPIRIYDCLKMYGQPFNPNQFCNFCKKATTVLRKRSIYSSSNIFIFSLDRKDLDSKFLQIPFIIDEKIEITNFLEMIDSPQYYQLTGIVSYYNKENKYVSFCMSPVDKQWYLFNDEKVSQTEIIQVIDLHNSKKEFIPCLLAYKAAKV